MVSKTISDGPNGVEGPVGKPSGPGPLRQNAVRRLALWPGHKKRLHHDASPSIGAKNRPRSGQGSPTLAIKRKGRTALPSQNSVGVGLKPFYFRLPYPHKKTRQFKEGRTDTLPSQLLIGKGFLAWICIRGMLSSKDTHKGRL